MKLTAVMLLLCALPGTVLAATAKQQTYDAPFDRVWIACVQAANENYTITHSEKDSGILSFQQGYSWKSWSAGTDVGVTVTKISDTQTEVSVHPQRRQSQVVSNIGHITSEYFKAVDAKLK